MNTLNLGYGCPRRPAKCIASCKKQDKNNIGYCLKRFCICVPKTDNDVPMYVFQSYIKRNKMT